MSCGALDCAAVQFWRACIEAHVENCGAVLWGVALTTLMNERASIGTASGGDVSAFTRIQAMVQHFGLTKDPIVREKMADLFIRTKVAGYNNQRAMDKIRAGQTPGPEMSIAKTRHKKSFIRF